jgi:hypothetical protein
VRSD